MGRTPTIKGMALSGGRPVYTAERPPTYEPPGLGRLRKIAMIGTAETINFAPFHDPSWEIWAHSSALPICPRVDRIFDLHPKHIWQGKKHWHKDYAGFLAKCPVPIYMQERYKAVPQSIRYPKERILSEFRRYVTSQTGWMIALALTEGVTHLGLFGIHYSHKDERGWQLACAEYWIGFAEGRGVQIVIPPDSPLLKNQRLYGYESHDADGKNLMAITDQGKKPFDPKALTIVNMDDPRGRIPLMKLPTGAPPNWAQSGHEHHY
jgi:hypothetical protein